MDKRDSKKNKLEGRRTLRSFSVSDKNKKMGYKAQEEVVFPDSSSTDVNEISTGVVEVEEAKIETVDIDELNIIPCFVPEVERYSCFLKGCDFKASTDIGLLVHVLHLHPSVNTFNCPHCPNNYYSTLYNVVDHLAMHGNSMYQCPYCSFFHFGSIIVNKHIKTKHPGLKVEVKEVRKSNIVVDVAKTVNKSLDVTKFDKKEFRKNWQCGVCEFSSTKNMMEHAKTSHKIVHQFKCALCFAWIPNHFYISCHCLFCHPDDVVNLVAYFYEIKSSLPIKKVNVIMPDGQNIFSPDSPIFDHKIPRAPLEKYFDGSGTSSVNETNLKILENEEIVEDFMNGEKQNKK